MANALNVKIGGDIRGLEKALNNATSKLRDAGKSMQRIGRTMTAGLTVPIGLAGGAMIKLASDAEETSSKFNTVFRDIREQAQQSADVLTDSFGLSQKASQELLSDTGDLLTGFGFTQKSALGLSEEVNKLAVDLASFTNFSGGAEGASRALTKALLGERESVKSLGISILETDVQAQVLRNTQQGLTFDTNRQAKAYATLQLAQQQSKNAIGDFERTQDSFANQMRQLRAEIEDLAVSIGKELIPIAKEITSIVRSAVERFSGLSQASKRLGLAIAGIAFVAGPTLIFFGSIARAISGLLVIIPKLIAGVKALTATMVANPYLAVGAAILAIGTRAFFSWKKVKDLNEEIKSVLDSDVQQTSMESVEDAIAGIQERIKKIRSDALSQGSLGLVSPKQQDELDRLNRQLAELETKRRQIRLEMLRTELENSAPPTKELTEETKKLTNSYKNFSVAAERVNDSPIFAPLQADALFQARKEAEKLYTPLSQLMDIDLDLGEKMPSPDSIMGITNSINLLRDAMVRAIDPEKISAYQERINQLQEKINELTGSTYQASDAFEYMGVKIDQLSNRALQTFNLLNEFTQSFTSALSQGIARAVVESEKFSDIWKDIKKQMASQAIQKLISVLLTGGLGGSGFFGSGGGVFGSIFGNAFSVNDALITSSGDVVKFNSADDILASKNMDKVIGGGGGDRVEVFGTLRGQDLFISSDRGSKTYSR